MKMRVKGISGDKHVYAISVRPMLGWHLDTKRTPIVINSDKKQFLKSLLRA